ncbi:MAG: tetratricopeptide repeat protein [Kiritimatiellia bacterium]
MEKNGRETGLSLGMRIGICALGSALVALVVYSWTLAGYIFPGESARLFTQWMGMDALQSPAHPVWGWFVKAFCGATISPTRLNLLSLVCGVLSAGLVSWLTAVFVAMAIHQEDTIKLVRGAAVCAGVVAGFAFVFSTAIWQTSTHLEYRLFDVTLALLLFSLPVLMAKWAKPGTFLALVLGVGVGVGLLESVIFAALLPLYLLALVVVTVKRGKKFYLPTALFLIGVFATYGLLFQTVANFYLGLPEAASSGLTDVGKIWQKMTAANVHEMRLWFSRPGWLYIVTLTVIPFMACLFASGRGLNNERIWSQYLFHAAMTVCAILATVTPLAPESVLRPFGVVPVATTTLAACLCGYLAAYWYLLARTPLPAVEYDKLPFVTVFGRKLAPVAGFVLAVLLALAAVVNAFDCVKDRGSFADACAREIIDRLGERSWLVTDGTLDDHLRVVAAARGKELNLICLHRDMDEAYLKEFSHLVQNKKLKAGHANLSLSIQLGVLPFLQDWFAGDTNVTREAAIFGVPDFWYMAERQPVPECLFFGGVDNMKAVDGKKAKADFLAFWEKIDAILPGVGKKGSRAIAEQDDPVVQLRLQLRRHVGFLANNLGVLLQDLGMESDAFEMYELVLKKIDCDNICALFNEFEQARAGVKEAVAHKVEISGKLKAIVDDPKRRYLLWSLSRYYGYIRSPEIFARMGYAWARSAQTGNAIAQVQRAASLVPADRQMGLLNMLASIYASGKQTKKSREVYQKVLDADATNHDAWMGLARLSMQNGALNDAKGFLEKAVKSATNRESAGFDWAILHMLNNDLAAARMSLQKVTDLQPKSLQAWALLAGVLLQQFDQAKNEAEKRKVLEELDGVILPKMETIAESPRDYHVQMTRALVLMRKGKAFQKQARDCLVAASAVRPDVSVVGDMILNLDIAMDDGESAEKHARQILRLDRGSKLANYVMGSLRLKEGDYLMAETFLRLSVEADKPIAAAQNDLAEVLRRLQRYPEAEKYARDATVTAPDLYVAWETLGSTLLDQNKNLDEAETCVKKAISLSKENSQIADIRMQITLARVQIARKDLGRARATLRTLRNHQNELSKYDLGVLDKLQKAAQGK